MPGRPAICGKERLALAVSMGLAAGAALAGVASSCSARDVVVDVPVVAYVPTACGSASGALVTFTGLGDFPQPTQAGQVVALGSNGLALQALPSATREVVITPVTDAGWTGAALVPEAGPVPVLTLPLDRACSLTGSVSAALVPGATLGMVDASHALLIAGAFAFAIDLGTGVVTALPPLATQLFYATITAFKTGVLVAGGQDEAGGPLATAVVYTPGQGGAPGAFGDPFPLAKGVARTQHAAVALPDGRILLIGGITSSIDSQGPVTVPDIDVFDPGTPGQLSFIAATLHSGRARPTVIALPDGQVFIGGGEDATGTPVKGIEWLDSSLAWHPGGALCDAAVAQGFAATEGGSVLAVMGQPATPGCSNVHLVLPFPGVIQEAPALEPAPTGVALFAGAQASPVLVTDGATLRWNPWTAAFAPLGPPSSGLGLPTSASVAASTGLAVWLGQGGDLWTLRFDTHGEYATDTAHGPYLSTDDLYTSPDRVLPGGGFSVAQGASLPGGATVWVTDETFASVTASVTLPDGGAASVVLRDPAGREVTCGMSGIAPYGEVQIVRAGASVTATVGTAGAPDGAAQAAVPCEGALDAGARVAVGVRGPDAGAATVRDLTVLR